MIPLALRCCATHIRLQHLVFRGFPCVTVSLHSLRNITHNSFKMEVEIEEAVNIYKDYSTIPTLANAYVYNANTAGHIRVCSEWTRRDLERSAKVKFSRHHIAQLDVVFPTTPTDISNELIRRESPSGQFQAILRKVTDKKGEEKQYIEIWDDSNKIQNIDVSKLEEHDKIYEDGEFGCLEWSHSETHLLYVAEQKRPTAKSFFDKSVKSGEGEKKDAVKGDENLFVDDWGEQLVGKSYPVLCVLDIEAGAVSVLDNLPDDVSAGQAIWNQDDSGVVCVGWWHNPYRLGLVYCPIRRSAIFHIDLKTSECTVIGSSKHSVRSPRFSPDYTKLVWLENQAGGPHQQCGKLMMCDWSTKGIVTVVDVVRKAPADKFQGLFTQRLPRRCWARDSRRLLLTTNWRSTMKSIVVDTTTGEIKTLPADANVGCLVVKDVHNGLVVASCSSPNQPNYLVVGQLPAAGKEETIQWNNMDNDPPRFLDFTWRIVSIDPPEDKVNAKFGPLDYEVILLEPTHQEVNKKPPLAVYIHGGPHSAFVADFMLYIAGLCKCGFAVLLINYRGSIGFGQDSIDSLPGHVGSQDVQDVQHAVTKALELEIADPERVFVIGGSHGGFLTAHAIAQFPNFYKAACCRNPVINMATLLGVSDIPDWCYTEGGLVFDPTQTGHAAVYDELWKRSPIRHIDQICTPTLLMIGLCDRRVPPQQGRELWKALRARNVPVRMLAYPDNAHPIDKVDSEADAFVNIIKWFRTYGA